MSLPPVLIRKSGLAIDAGPVDGRPFPGPVLDAVCGQLVYTHMEFLRGQDRYLPDGTVRNVKTEQRRLYDMQGPRIQSGFGFLPRIVSALQQFGYTLQFEDISPPLPRPEAFIPDWDNLARWATTPWRAKQLECVQAIIGAPGGIIDAVPAFGKTEIIARLCLLYPRAKIAIVTKSTDVARGIERRLHAYLPEVGFVGDGSCVKRRVTVYVAKSLHKADGDTDFVFADEIHQLASDWYSERLLRAFDNPRMFGFSATWDGRTDGAHARLEYMFGPVIFYLGWQEATALGLIVPVTVNWINVQMSVNPCARYSQDVTRKRHGIWRNARRNELIAQAARQYTPLAQTLILVETIEHAVALRQYLPEFALCYHKMEPDDLHTFKVHGLLPQDYIPLDSGQRDQLRRQFENAELHKVIATDVWSTGVSFEQLAVLMRADARSSEIMDDQAPGRVIRLHEASGKEFGLVYDCFDHFDPTLKRKSQERYRRYEKKGWAQNLPPLLERATL